MSQRDLEAAQQAYNTATARLGAAQSDEATAKEELERQQKLAASDVAGVAEVQQAQAALAQAQADVRTRNAEVARARSSVRLASVALERETSIFKAGTSNRREVSGARTALENAETALVKARQTLAVTTAALKREQRLFSQNVANRREVSQAWANLQTAQSQQTQARQTTAVAEAVLRREVGIFRQNLNNISQVQAARATYVSAQSDLQAARTALSLLKSAPGGRASIPIVAPIAGVVQGREVAQGEVLAADAHLMTIVDLSVLHVDMFLPERDIARVRIGSPVKVNVDAVPGRLFTGRVELIHTEVDPKTRTVEAHAELRNNGALRVGMSARGQIVTASGAAVVLVPAAAVQDFEGKKIVFVQADEPNAFVKREVKLGATESGKTIIKNGLKPGERVVVKGAFMVKAQAMEAELGHSH